MTAYADFLAERRSQAPASGFQVVPAELHADLYAFQREIVSWALERGRAAIFADCGLGKTPMQLEWARQLGGNVLILAPLAVGAQTRREGEKFGIPVTLCRETEDVRPGINVANYERLPRFQHLEWTGLVLDESSILKAFDGKTRDVLTTWAQKIPYRLCATATPSPNDYEELGGHAEFLGILNRRQMLAEFFVNDGLSAAHWRLKGHGGSAYWQWLATWARAFRQPADLGYADNGFALPPLTVEYVPVDGDHVSGDRLFPVTVSTLAERRQARRESLPQRAHLAADLVNASDEPWVVWCDLNAESDLLRRLIPDAVEVRGSDTSDEKESRLLAFSNSEARVIVTKPRIGGWGLNWQHCPNMVFVGLSDSYEAYYQAVRRCWRFGQTRPVNVWIVASRLEQTVLANIRRKEAQAAEMFTQVIAAMGRAA